MEVCVEKCCFGSNPTSDTKVKLEKGHSLDFVF